MAKISLNIEADSAAELAQAVLECAEEFGGAMAPAIYDTEEQAAPEVAREEPTQPVEPAAEPKRRGPKPKAPEASDEPIKAAEGDAVAARPVQADTQAEVIGTNPSQSTARAEATLPKDVPASEKDFIVFMNQTISALEAKGMSKPDILKKVLAVTQEHGDGARGAAHLYSKNNPKLIVAVVNAYKALVNE